MVASIAHIILMAAAGSFHMNFHVTTEADYHPDIQKKPAVAGDVHKIFTSTRNDLIN